MKLGSNYLLLITTMAWNLNSSLVLSVCAEDMAYICKFLFSKASLLNWNYEMLERT